MINPSSRLAAPVQSAPVKAGRRLRRRAFQALAVSAAIAALPLATANAATVGPANDTYVDSTNYQSAPLLKVTGTPSSQALLRFSVPSGTYSSAKLRLYASTSSAEGVTVRTASNTWTISTVTWNTRPALGTAVGSKSSLAAGWNDIAVPTSAVPGGSSVTLQLTKSAGSTVKFQSKNNTYPAQLVLTEATTAPALLPASPTTTAAAPLWNGDTFTLNRTSVSTGGEGTLSPYQWSSAWQEGRGFLAHSNTNPAVHGATVVPDPSGLSRSVIKLNTDERINNTGLVSKPYTRMEVRGKAQFGPGMDRWVISEVFIPTDTPTMPTASSWWTIQSIFGPPYAGASPNTFGMSRNLAGTGNDITWKTPGGTVMWRTPATKGVWHILARKIKFSTSATDGYSEIWYSQRDAQGNVIQPLTRQTVTPPNASPTQTYHYVTLGPNNWDGTSLNHADIKNYHTANMWPGRTYTALYFARFRVYDGATPVNQIDPYYREIFEAAFSAHHRWRNNHRLQRRIIARLQPALAAVPTTRGGSAEPIAIRNVHQLVPYYASVAQRAGRKLATRGKPAHAAAPGATASERYARTTGALRERGVLDPAEMCSGELYDRGALESLLARSAKEDFAEWTLMGRVATVELALRLASGEESNVTPSEGQATRLVP